MKLIFLGGQGSGKTTQAKLLADELGLPHFEMGHLLRERSAKNDELGEEMKKTLNQGHLVKDELTVNTLREKVQSASDGYILDGYPRNFAQYEALDPDIDLVFYVRVSDDEATRRLLLRSRSDDTEEALAKRLEIYHSQTEPLLEKFRQKGILKEVDGERPIDAIHEEISQVIKTNKKYQ